MAPAGRGVALALLSATLALAWAALPAQAGPAWLPMATPSGLDISSAGFVSPDEGWLIGTFYSAVEGGSVNSILRTKDGGAHWESVFQHDPVLEFGPACFLDDQHGWVVARDWRTVPRDDRQRCDYHVFRTTDGGRSWTKSAVSLGFELLFLNDMVFADPSIGFILGSGRRGIDAVIFRTLDGGPRGSATLRREPSGVQTASARRASSIPRTAGLSQAGPFAGRRGAWPSCTRGTGVSLGNDNTAARASLRPTWCEGSRTWTSWIPPTAGR